MTTTAHDIRLRAANLDELSSGSDVVAFSIHENGQYPNMSANDILILPPKDPILALAQQLFGSDRKAILSELFARIDAGISAGKNPTVNVRVFPAIDSNGNTSGPNLSSYAFSGQNTSFHPKFKESIRQQLG